MFNNVTLSSYPRMADFAKWVVAAEPRLPWKKGKFLSVYRENREEAALGCFESDVVAIALRAFIESIGKGEGTTSELKNALEDHQDDIALMNDRSWPKRPNYLSNRVKRIAPALREVGIEVEYPRINGKKIWRFQFNDPEGVDG
ncbi:MAG: hypothetical protein JSV56_01525 [Methanomassiliicoccales archaeon]|nr:MAG: hypothetical protein JSV56_01525 [Methanomassiliicoccales archaeon]